MRPHPPSLSYHACLRKGVSVCMSCLALLWSSASSAFGGFDAPTCPPGSYEVYPSPSYRISTNGQVVKPLKPYFFGFNFESVIVLRSLYDTKTKALDPKLISYLSAFPGAVYRYPGGIVSNYYNFSKAGSPPYLSPDGKSVYQLFWFNFDDYMHFLTQVHGQAWLVANLYGSSPRDEEPIGPLVTLAKQWTARTLQDRQAGLPPVLRWELGNELDRNDVKWNDLIYASRASAIAGAIRSVDPQARIVAMLEDVPAHRWTSPFDYNANTAQALASYAPGYAQHVYYDGFPGQPVPDRVNYLCKDMQAVANAGQPQAEIWVTETAVRPPVPWQGIDWKKVKWQTKDLSSTISEADMRIALTQFPQVKGAFLHAIYATGPWATFYRDASGVLHPTLPYWGMRLLRQSMLDEVLMTYTQSRNSSGYAGGYDLRASILTNQAHTAYAIWMANRAANAIPVELQIPSLAGQTFSATLTSLANANVHATDSPRQDILRPVAHPETLHFDGAGNSSLSIPGNSVSALTFSKQ